MINSLAHRTTWLRSDFVNVFTTSSLSVRYAIVPITETLTIRRTQETAISIFLVIILLSLCISPPQTAFLSLSAVSKLLIRAPFRLSFDYASVSDVSSSSGFLPVSISTIRSAVESTNIIIHGVRFASSPVFT